MVVTQFNLQALRKLANNPLLASFPASISENPPDFSFAADSCKGLKMLICLKTKSQHCDKHFVHHHYHLVNLTGSQTL